jgi:group I intron endonuclease
MKIYKISNNFDSKVYIGQTKDRLSKRFLGHYHNKSHDSHLSNALKKHGRENFKIEEIDSAQTQEELDEKEIYWIKFYNSMDREKGYNILPGGGGRSHTEESKKKMSETRKGMKRSPESIEKTRQANLGRKRKEGTGAKISAANKGRKKRPWTEEEKKMISERSKGRKPTEEALKNMKVAARSRKRPSEFTEEHRTNLSNSRKGRVVSPETREKIRQSNIRTKALKKSLTKASDKE